MSIIIIENNWGTASIENIQKVLESAYTELTSVCATEVTYPIRVKHRIDGDTPLTLYNRSSSGEYVILLAISDMYWDQYAYQFSHELCHILSNHDKNKGNKCRWFDETICELASLFTLRRMVASWSITPPYQNWADYATKLREYADKYLKSEERAMPKGHNLQTWFTVHRSQLETNPYNRKLNGLIANILLPVFEHNPIIWRTVIYLNTYDLSDNDSFEVFLNKWKQEVPINLQEHVKVISDMFGITL